MLHGCSRPTEDEVLVYDLYYLCLHDITVCNERLMILCPLRTICDCCLCIVNWWPLMQDVNFYFVNAFVIMILSIMYFSWICLSSWMLKLWTSITFVTCLKSVQRFCKNASRLFWLWNAIFTLFLWFLICHSDTVINDAIVHCRMGIVPSCS